MKFIVGCLFAALLCMVNYVATAQAKLSNIKGKIVIENNGAPGEVVTALLTYPDSIALKTILSKKDGSFEFDGVLPKTYLLKFTKIGFAKTFYGPFQVKTGQDLSVANITLLPASKKLKEVIITAQRNYVELKSDKTVLNVDQSIGAAGGSVYDVLKMAPGVKVVDDQILYQAGQKALIAINGRPVNLTDEQLADLLKSYPASTISQIELIRSPSAKYDAASAGGVVNIVLKKSKDLGLSATVTQNGSYGDRTQSSTTLNVSVRKRKLNIFTSYNFTDGKSTRTFTNDRSISTDQLYNFNLNYKGVTHYINNNFTFGADYLISKSQTLGMLISGYANHNDIDKFSTTNIYTAGKPDSSIKTRSRINRDLSTLNYDLNYKNSFGSSGNSTLSANADYSDYNRHSSENLNDVTYDPTGRRIGDTLFYRDQSPSHIQIWSGKVDFSQVLSRNSSIDAGAKVSRVTSYNDLNFNQDIAGIDEPVPALTDNFVYKETIAAGYVVYNVKYKGYAFGFNLRGEKTSSDAISVNPQTTVQRNYFDLFPKLTIEKSIDKNNELSFAYSRSITRPSYQDLNPFIGYVNQFYYTTGNPFLKPEYFNSFSLSNLYLNKFRATLSMVITNDFSSTIFRQNDTTKVYTVTKNNIATRYQYIAEFEAPVELARWWNVNFNLKGSFEKYDYTADNLSDKTTVDLALVADQRFVLTKKLTAQVYGTYEIPTYYGISQYKSFYFLDAGMRYSVLSGNGSIALFMNDIFDTNIARYHTNFQNLDLTARDKYPNRYLNATFTYRFGKRSVKSVPKHNLGDDEETGRLHSDN